MTVIEPGKQFLHARWTPDGGCPARDLLDRIGDKWSLVVLFSLQNGSIRFNALKRHIAGISQRILTMTLRGLERDGYVTRIEAAGLVAQVEYSLTQLGWDLVELTKAIEGWARSNDHRITRARGMFDESHAVG